MQSVGFNASPFSFQTKIAVPFSAQANTPVLQQAPRSDEILFAGRVRTSAKRGGRIIGGGGEDPGKRSNQKSEKGHYATDANRRNNRIYSSKLRHQAEYAKGVVTKEQSDAAEIARKGAKGGLQASQAVINAIRPHMTPEQIAHMEALKGSPPPESKANPTQLPAAPGGMLPQPFPREVIDWRWGPGDAQHAEGTRTTYPLSDGLADLNSPFQHPSARKADDIHQNLEGPGITPKLSYSQPYWQTYNP